MTEIANTVEHHGKQDCPANEAALPESIDAKKAQAVANYFDERRSNNGACRRAYAARHAADHPDFPAFLRGLAARPGFFEVCDGLHEVGPERPFYPRRGRAGMTRLSHARALGLPDAAALLRACDRATAIVHFHGAAKYPQYFYGQLGRQSLDARPAHLEVTPTPNM